MRWYEVYIWAIILTTALWALVSIYVSQWVYSGLSTASEVFLILTTQLYPCLCHFKAVVFIC